MATWILSLSWTLIYSLVQGGIVYIALRLVLQLLKTISAEVRYHLALSAMGAMTIWFAATWWQQYHYYLAAQVATVSRGATMLLPAKGEDASRHALLTLFYRALPWLSVFYTCGLLFMVVRLSAGIGRLLPMKTKGVSAPDSHMQAMLAVAKERLDAGSNARLFLSAMAQVPMVIGFLKPVILMPVAAATQLDAVQIEAILLHELAHIKRHDYLVNMLQTVVEAILFFNPFVWMVSSIVRREREHCCDDLVLQHTQEPLSYATALASLAEPGSLSFLAIAANYPLYDRVERIMERRGSKPGYGRMAAAAILTVIITVSAVLFTSSFTKPGNGAKKNKQANGRQTTLTEEEILVQRLEDARLVDEVTGFLVVRQGSALYVNGVAQPADVAGRCLSGLDKVNMRVQVFSLEERIKMHPDAGFLQVLLPVKTSSGCVQTSSKPGC